MEIIAKQLSIHHFNEDYINRNCSPNTLKDSSLEWNKKGNKAHAFADDIESSDIAISFRDVVTNEDYSFFFFKKQPIGDGIIFTITKCIIDYNLPETYIRTAVENVLTTLVNGRYTRYDRLVAKRNYPFYEPHIADTVEKVSQVIRSSVRKSRNGLVD